MKTNCAICGSSYARIFIVAGIFTRTHRVSLCYLHESMAKTHAFSGEGLSRKASFVAPLEYMTGRV